MINEVKAKVQKEALDALHLNNGGLVAIATGGGKSKIAIDYSLDLKRNKDDLKIILVVPTRTLRDTDWKDEFYKWNASHLWENSVRKECYAYISKIKNEHFDLVILDEVQHITELNHEFFINNTIDKIVSLSATPPKEKIKRELLFSLGVRVVYEISLDEAVELGLVAPYNLVLIETQLNRTSEYIETGGKKRKWMTTENRQYEYLSNSISRAKYMGINANIMKFKYLHRMRFIYNLRSKEVIAKHVLETIIPKEERTLIFAGSIAAAEALCDKRYHSKSTDEDLNAFRNEEINRLSAVQALNEGVNIANVDNAFIVQLNSKERNLIQRMGRILRHREGHKGTIYIMYVKNTVDEKWLESAMENIDKSNITRLKMST